MSLYEIDRDLRDVMQNIEVYAEENEGEFPEELDKIMDDLLGDKHTKIGNICKLIKSLNAEQKAIKEEAKSLTLRANSAKKKSDFFKEYLEQSLNGEKFSDNNSKISYRNTPSVYIPGKLVVEEQNEIWLSVKYAWNKTALKDTIKAGEKVPEGVEMQTKKSMQIK